jgi:hypothetical protein
MHSGAALLFRITLTTDGPERELLTDNEAFADRCLS